MIFTAWEKCQLLEGEGWEQLQLNFPIFHSEQRRKIFSFAHIANSPKLSQGAGRSEEVLEEGRRTRLPGFPGTAWLMLNSKKAQAGKCMNLSLPTPSSHDYQRCIKFRLKIFPG